MTVQNNWKEKQVYFLLKWGRLGGFHQIWLMKRYFQKMPMNQIEIKIYPEAKFLAIRKCSIQGPEPERCSIHGLSMPKPNIFCWKQLPNK